MVKNMPCDICGKLFGIEKQLARHRLYHFVRFECQVEGCDEYFNTAARLQKHMKNDHRQDNSTKYECEVEGCIKIFTSEKRLESHMKKKH
jgi:hypothetical protein